MMIYGDLKLFIVIYGDLCWFIMVYGDKKKFYGDLKWSMVV